MSIERCPRCHDLNFDGKPCTCRAFTYYEYEGDDNPSTVYGKSFTDIVESMAEDYNSGDPVFDEDIFEEPIVLVDDQGVRKKFNCWAEVSIDYTAEEIEDEETDETEE